MGVHLTQTEQSIYILVTVMAFYAVNRLAKIFTLLAMGIVFYCFRRDLTQFLGFFFSLICGYKSLRDIHLDVD